MPTPTGDNRELLTVIAFMRGAVGKREELKAALGVLGAGISECPGGEFGSVR